jgi:hypothetical protein
VRVVALGAGIERNDIDPPFRRDPENVFQEGAAVTLFPGGGEGGEVVDVEVFPVEQEMQEGGSPTRSSP